MSLRRELDHVEADLAPAAPWVLGPVGAALLLLAVVIVYVGLTPRPPAQEAPPEPTVERALQPHPDCSLEPDAGPCARVRPALLDKPITPRQAFDAATTGLPETRFTARSGDRSTWRELLPEESAAVRVLYRQRQRMGDRHYVEHQDDYHMPAIEPAADLPTRHVQVYGLERALAQRERLHLAWRAKLRETGLEGALTPLDHDRWMVERARWELIELQRARALQQNMMVCAAALVLVLGGLTLLVLAGTGRRVRIRVAQGSVQIDGVRIPSTEVLDVRWTRGRLVIEGVHDTWSSRASVSDAEGVELVEAIGELLGDHELRHEEVSAEARVRTESRRLRRRA